MNPKLKTPFKEFEIRRFDENKSYFFIYKRDFLYGIWDCKSGGREIPEELKDYINLVYHLDI